MDALFNRGPPTIWEELTSSPILFLARKLYSPGTRPTPPIEDPGKPVPPDTVADPDDKRITIVCISDTHNTHHSQPAPPAGDILIHAGDLTSTGTFPELDNVLLWLASQPHQHKVFIAGNHDVGLSAAHQAKSNSSHMSPQYIASTYPSLTYLQDSSAELRVRGRVLRIYGSPYTPTQGAWAFQHPRRSDALRETWARIPPLTDILITHGPPFGHLDLVRETNAGCAELLASVWRIRPKVHVFGHIHAARGVEYVRWDARQEVYESVLRGESGWKGVAWLAWHKALDWLTGWGGVGLGDEGTLMVNAAAVGGWRDRELNGAVVVRV